MSVARAHGITIDDLGSNPFASASPNRVVSNPMTNTRPTRQIHFPARSAITQCKIRLSTVREPTGMLGEPPLVVDFTKEGDAFQIHPLGARLYSHDAAWNGICLHYYHYPPDEFPTVCFKQHILVIHTEVPPSTQVEQTIDGCFQSAQFSAGDIIIVPAGISYRARWDTEHSFIILGLEPTLLAHHALETIEQDDVELVPYFLKHDPFIHGVGLAFKTELESNGLGGRFYTDSLITALLAYLLRNYSTHKPNLRELKGGFSKYKLKQVMDYINDHLAEDVSLEAIATQVGMSQSHFFSLFRQSTGLSPHQYRLKQRIERAKELLLRSELSIANIAISVGFYDQSHLARHMRRLLGVSPKQLRASSIID